METISLNNKPETLVSVIIPTYKRDKKMLERALTSVIKQTYSNIEILVVDDNKEVEYSKQIEDLLIEINDNRIILLKNKDNIGGVASRNKGIKFAKGNYISFLDDDDYYMPEKLRKQVLYLEDSNYDFIISNLAIVDDNLKVKDIRSHKWLTDNINNNDLIIGHYKNHLTGTPTFLFKKEILLRVKGFPKVNMGHEFFLVNNLLESGFKIGYLNEALAVAVLHKGERISNSSSRQEDLDELLDFKVRDSNKLKSRDRKRIYHRHYLAKAFAYIHSSNYFKSFICILVSFYYSPNKFLEELSKRIKLLFEGRYLINERIK